MLPRVPGLLKRMKAMSRKLSNSVVKGVEQAKLKKEISALQPSKRAAIVVITGLSPGGLDGPGKVVASRFFPPFCAHLAKSAIGTICATSMGEFRSAVSRSEPAVIVNVYREVAYRIDRPEILEIERQAAGVFNRAEAGPIVADKDESNLYLTGRSVAMPTLAAQGKVFSNSRQDSGASVSVLTSLEQADASRYNTEFIDTRVTHCGKTYYTCVRLLCIGSKIVHAYVRARDVEDGSPSVHAFDTPLDGPLVEFLQRKLVDDRLAELADLPEKIATALGPGFYAHDVLLDADGGVPLLCETGFKFHDAPYERRLSPIADRLPSHRIIFSMSELAERSAGLFVDECARLGFL
jgi:hypothetical protein